jgi:hypothetical protein
MMNDKIVLEAQAEIDKKMDNMMKRATWVNIIMGMEILKKLEYEQEMRS